jgi:hypothetical protein
MSKSFDQFRRDNIVTTLPTTLEYGKEVYYKDANGNLTLWVGHEDGTAWPAVGYKEYVALLTQTGTNAPVATVLSNTLGTVTFSRQDIGTYSINSSSLFTQNKNSAMGARMFWFNTQAIDVDKYGFTIWVSASAIELTTFEVDSQSDNQLTNQEFSIRIYP